MKHFLIFAMRAVCYDSYLYFADSLAKALTAAGHSVEIFSGEKEPLEAMEQFAGRTFDGIFDFNSQLPKLKMENANYFLDEIAAPFYNIILDHPLYHHGSLKQTLSNFHVLCLDENHKSYIETYYPHISSVHVFTMTGEDILPSDDTYPDKNIDLLFSGTYTDYRQVADSIRTCPDFLGNLTRKLIDILLEDNSFTQEAALKMLLPDLEEAEIIQETFPLHMQACFLCDSYLRAYKREQLLLSLAKENLPLTLCGNGWKNSPLADFSQIKFIHDTSFYDTFSLFRKTKITLNLLPEFKNGSHDRIYSAMLNHSLSLTDATPMLSKQFTDKKELCFYDAHNFKNITTQIQDLLSHPKQLEEISQTGYFKAKESHSWQARVESLLNMGI